MVELSGSTHPGLRDVRGLAGDGWRGPGDPRLIAACYVFTIIAYVSGT